MRRRAAPALVVGCRAGAYNYIEGNGEIWQFPLVAGAGISRGDSGGAIQVQHAGDEIADGDAQVAPEPLLQAGIILRATEEVGHQLAENGVAANELHHARGHSPAEERAQIEAAHDARGKFKLAGE